MAETPKNAWETNTQLGKVDNKLIRSNKQEGVKKIIKIPNKSKEHTLTPSNTETTEKIPSSDYFKKQVELWISILKTGKKNQLGFPKKDDMIVFEELIKDIDTQDYHWKTGKDRKAKYKGIDVIIKNGSYEAKFIQVILASLWYKFDKANFRSFDYHIDGSIWMETIRTIVAYKKDIQTLNSAKKYSDNSISSHEKQETLDYIKGQLGDLISEIEQTNTNNKISRKSERNLKINIIGNNLLEVSSYGESKSTIDLGKGKGNVKILWKYDFPYRLNLQYSDNGEILKNETNKINIKNMIQLINIVHSIIYDYIYSLSGEKIINKLEPFYIGMRFNIYVDTGIINDTRLIDISVLNRVLKDSTGWSKNANFLVKFLNTIYRDMTKEEPKVKEVSKSRTI